MQITPKGAPLLLPRIFKEGETPVVRVREALSGMA
jgi:hypothetical protein